MDSLQIEKILRANSVTAPHFLGCFPIDQIPRKSSFHKYPQSLVVNLDPAREAGSHWIALFIPGSDKALYWDSLALDPAAEPIQQYLSQFPNVERNKFQYQEITADTCAHYCICFIYFLSIGKSYPYFVQLLHSQKPNAEYFVKKFINKMVNYYW